MKKNGLIVSVLLIFALPLFASPSWIGVQAFTTSSRNNPVLAIWGVDLEGESVATLAGVNISRSVYPAKRSPFGFGFQVGASEMYNISSNTTDIDLSDAFSLVGGIGASLPIYTQRKISGGTTLTRRMLTWKG